MASTSIQDDDMYLFQGGMDQTPSAYVGQDFDTFLVDSPGNGLGQPSNAGFMNPNDLAIKREPTEARLKGQRSSPQSSASSSSSELSAGYTHGYISKATTVSPATTTRQQGWSGQSNGMNMAAAEQYYDDASMAGIDNDIDASNQEMASAFDFETAASTPSGYDAASLMTMKPGSAQAFRRTANLSNFGQQKISSPRLPVGSQSQFYLGSREASPLNAMLPQTQGPSPWTKHSPSSGLEETFNHITMNADSPGNATFSPTMQFSANGFTFDADSTHTPSTYHKEISSPPSTIYSGDGSSRLTVYPTSLKSRVETQIPIKMVLYPLPAGAKKLRLPTHTVSKPKFLAKPEVERSSDILELYTSLVCTSAMQDQARLDRALARARGEQDLSAYSKPSPASSTGSQTSSRDDEDKPLHGGEVKICSGCIQRERKRASRKKQKKPEEEELFQKDEEKRVVVFNTSEIKDWTEVNKENLPSIEHLPPPPPGAMQVELPMRIACYCRHQNEKMGFQVIFTIKDCREKVIAQAMTNSIMITDDHKTHNAPPPSQTGQSHHVPSAPHLPGAGVFSTSGMDMQNGHPHNAKLFKQSFSTTDLQNLQHNFNPHFPMSPTTNPFAITGSMSAGASGTMTPRILSRPASPSGPSGPTSKRRKQSGSGKVPSGLTMTRLDTAPSGAATMPNTAASSPYATNMQAFISPSDRYGLAASRGQPFGTSPPTPNGHDTFAAAVNRSFSLENLPRQALMSAPSSRHPSRPSSPRPTSNRENHSGHDTAFSQAVSNSLVGQPSRRPPPIIHKLVPAEGSVTGGTEVTLLGNGFYQGLEVMFGDTEATTTTFWGEKCLNCIAPPALQAGVVAVMFKHEHPQYAAVPPQTQPRHSYFTYTDDREVEMLRLALRTIGKQLQHPTDDPYTAAQQLLQQNQQQQQQQQQQPGMWPQHGGYAMSMQTQMGQLDTQQSDLLRLENSMLNVLRYANHRPQQRLLSGLRRPSGLTLLHLSASMGLFNVTDALLSAGADPNSRDNGGHTPLHHAAMHGHEKVITRLKLAGGDHCIRSLRYFTPIDMATTLSAYQAMLRPYQHFRSHSTDSIRQRYGRDASSVSLEQFWDHSSDVYEDSDSDFDSDSQAVEDVDEDLQSKLSQKNERRIPFAHPGPIVARSQATSRRNSIQPSISRPRLSRTSTDGTEAPTSPGAFMQAWRQLLDLTHLQQQQLAQQIQQIQGSIAHLPNIPQDYPVVRRMNALLPLRNGATEMSQRDSVSSTTGPPAYEDLYPGSGSGSGFGSAEDFSIKKASAVQAAADAAVDDHFKSQETGKTSVRMPLRRVELTQDWRMFFFWIPIALLFLGFWLHSSGVLQHLFVTQNSDVAMTREAVVEVL